MPLQQTSPSKAAQPWNRRGKLEPFLTTMEADRLSKVTLELDRPGYPSWLYYFLPIWSPSLTFLICIMGTLPTSMFGLQ